MSVRSKLLSAALLAVAFTGLLRAADHQYAKASVREPARNAEAFPRADRYTSFPVSRAARYQPASRTGSIRAIRAVFGRTAPAAVRVAGCETGWTYDSRAVSRTGDYGLFQANYSAHHWRGESRAEFAARHFNLYYNVRWAYLLSRGGTDWRAWACRP